jgi:hypothetical protein
MALEKPDGFYHASFGSVRMDAMPDVQNAAGKNVGFFGLERFSHLRGCAGAHGQRYPLPSAALFTGSLSPRRRKSNGTGASAARELHFVVGLF